MSFFQSKLGTIYNNEEISLQLTVIDMFNEADYHKICQQLLEINGVSDVKPFERPKKLVVSFNNKITNIETIVFAISRLGYHYINRACKKCGFY